MSNNIHDRMDEISQDRGDFRPTTSTPHYNQDHLLATNSPRPGHNYRFPEHEGSQQHPYPNNEANDQDPAATVQAYYNRYGGQGPMTVPGSDYSSKYGQVDESEQGGNANNGQLYEKYDSPDSGSAAGEISESNSVSGMALQDRPTGNNPQVWEKFFKAGLYGANVYRTQAPNQKVGMNSFSRETGLNNRDDFQRLRFTLQNINQ